MREEFVALGRGSRTSFFDRLEGSDVVPRPVVPDGCLVLTVAMSMNAGRPSRVGGTQPGAILGVMLVRQKPQVFQVQAVARMANMVNLKTVRHGPMSKRVGYAVNSAHLPVMSNLPISIRVMFLGPPEAFAIPD